MLNSAFRECIYPQIFEFKVENRHIIICELCGGDLIDNHIDHILQFNIIVKNFLKENKLKVPNKFNDCKLSNKAIFKNEDKEFSKSFYKYHKENAILRKICSTCNLKRPKIEFKNKK